LYEVLFLLSSAVGSFPDYLFYLPLFSSFYVVRWGFDEVGSMFFSLREWREKRGMEDVVNLPRFREVVTPCGA
jgi:hypothetical protein